MDMVKNNSIGMGLTCSQLIIRELNGTLLLKQSNNGKTVFSIEMPVNFIQKREFQINSHVKQNEFDFIFNFDRELKWAINQYLVYQLGDSHHYFEKLHSMI